MKKINSVKDITSGMLVTLRNGDKMTVVTTTIYGNMDKCCTGLSLFGPAVGEDGDDEFWPLSEYDSDFKCKHTLFGEFLNDGDDAIKVHLPEFDIVQVWGCTCPSNAFANTTEDRALLWSDPSYNAKSWDELTEEEKAAECSKHIDCNDCPYDNKGCGDFDGMPCGDCKPDPTADVGEPEAEDADNLVTLLDEMREYCKENLLVTLLFVALADKLPEGHADYILGKTDKNPERKAPPCANKSLAEQLYEKDKELADDGVSVVERDLALLTAMHLACGDHKE